MFLTGRTSELIISGGVNIYPAEIEAVLIQHPAVADVGVFGVPDDEWGERVAVCAVAEGELDLTALREWGKQHLASYKVPSLLCIRAELPRNAMGKVQKHLVRQLFEDADRSTGVIG